MTTDGEPKPVEVEPVIGAVAIPPYVQTLLETIATREGFADGYQITSQSGSNVGDGFVGILLSAVISGTREELVLVCKIPPVSEMRQKFAVKPFQQEIFAYEKILPALVEFQREKGISQSDGFFSFPKCYGTYANEEKYEFAIVLEDLRHNGFRMWNKYKPVDYRHVTMAFKELGKFHALSYALRQQRPDLFAQFQSLDSTIYKVLDEIPVSKTHYEKCYDRALETLNPEDTEEIRKITYLRQHFKDFFRTAVNGAAAEPFSVLCHGDFWNNNMMFQYSSADSLEPQRVYLIDWQLTQYCSPVTDLTYYLYSSTEQTVRTDHFDDIFHDYHSSLANLLEKLGGNADRQFSFEDLQQQLDTFGIYGMVLAPILIPAITIKAEDIPDLDAMTAENIEEYDLMAKGNPDGYNKRVSDVIRDFVGRGFFGEKHFVWLDAEEN